MSYKTEFPDYDGQLYVPKGFIDASWHNDIMPRAEKIIKVPQYANEVEAEVAFILCETEAEVQFILWQDYADPQKREYDNGKRYIFQIEINGESIFEVTTDDLDIAKQIIKCIA